MHCNMGTIDRIIRAVVGSALVAVFFLVPLENIYLYWGSLGAGIVMLATAALGFCPPYLIFGISTCGTKGNSK